MQQIQSAVVYDGLPISSGGAHGLGRTSVYDAFSSWRGFLESCTVTDDVSCYFHLPHTPELEPARKTVREIRKAFPAKGHRFPVPQDRIHEALDLLASLEPLPTNPWGMAPVWLSADGAVRLKTPAGDTWPHQRPTAFGAFETPDSHPTTGPAGPSPKTATPTAPTASPPESPQRSSVSGTAAHCPGSLRRH